MNQSQQKALLILKQAKRLQRPSPTIAVLL
jgi:hypothetical protein